MYRVGHTHLVALGAYGSPLNASMYWAYGFMRHRSAVRAVRRVSPNASVLQYTTSASSHHFPCTNLKSTEAPSLRCDSPHQPAPSTCAGRAGEVISSCKRCQSNEILQTIRNSDVLLGQLITPSLINSYGTSNELTRSSERVAVFSDVGLYT